MLAAMSGPTVVREPARDTGAAVDLQRVTGDAIESATDTVAVEEPLEIRLNGWRWMVTMRTPGDDADLIVGLLASEGVITSAAEVEAILFTRHPDEPELANVADVAAHTPARRAASAAHPHQSFTSSSCGLCGASAIEAILAHRPPVPPGPGVAAGMLAELPERLVAGQPLFRKTGGLHAAALFDSEGTLLVAREDIGRHNATDKALGWRLRAAQAATAATPAGAGAPAETAAILLVSGRASFEIVQKALAGRIPIVAAVSAPSNLAVTLARQAGLTLAGFVREGRFNLYAGGDRVVTAVDDAALDAHSTRGTDRPRRGGAQDLARRLASAHARRAPVPGASGRRGVRAVRSLPRRSRDRAHRPRAATLRPRRQRRTVSLPFGLGAAKPHHYRDMLRVAWQNRDQLGFAWRILRDGVCDGCALGPRGLRDDVIDGVHLCMTRLELLRLNTMPSLDPVVLEDLASPAADDERGAARARPRAVSAPARARRPRRSAASPGAPRRSSRGRVFVRRRRTGSRSSPPRAG